MKSVLGSPGWVRQGLCLRAHARVCSRACLCVRARVLFSFHQFVLGALGSRSCSQQSTVLHHLARLLQSTALPNGPPPTLAGARGRRNLSAQGGQRAGGGRGGE